MAVREYVGARYVPIFADQPWTNTLAYEPLTVVLYQGNSYTSRQYVPVGIDISNEEFWAETGNYNAQVEAYRKEVSNVVDALNEKVDKFTDVVWIGDSYVQANSLSDKSKRFSTVVSNKLGLTEHNYAVGGSGYSTGTTFEQQAVTAVNDTSYDHDKVQYVFVCGGRNDAFANPNWTSTQIGTSVQNCIVKLVAGYKNAKIVIVPMLFDAETLPGSYYRWYQGILQNANQQVWGVIRYGYSWLTGNYNYILEDNVHPSETGHAVISHYIYNYLTGSFAQREDSYFEIIRNTEIVSNGGNFTLNNIGVTAFINAWFKTANVCQSGTNLFYRQVQSLNMAVPVNSGPFTLKLLNTDTLTEYYSVLSYIKNETDIEYMVKALSEIPVGTYICSGTFNIGTRQNVVG